MSWVVRLSTSFTHQSCLPKRAPYMWCSCWSEIGKKIEKSSEGFESLFTRLIRSWPKCHMLQRRPWEWQKRAEMAAADAEMAARRAQSEARDAEMAARRAQSEARDASRTARKRCQWYYGTIVLLMTKLRCGDLEHDHENWSQVPNAMGNIFELRVSQCPWSCSIAQSGSFRERSCKEKKQGRQTFKARKSQAI